MKKISWVLIIQSPWGIDIQHSILSTISVSLRFFIIRCCHTFLLLLIHPSNLAWSAFLPVIRIHFEFSHVSSDSHQPGLSCQQFSPADSSSNLLQLSLLSLVLFYSLCFEQSCSTELMFNTPRLKPSKLEPTVFSISSDCLSHILRGSTASNACLPLEFFSNVNYDDTQCRHFGQLISWTH